MAADRVRHAIVTGGADGIGAGVVERLLSDGLGVVAVDVSVTALEELATRLGRPDALVTVVGDVAEPATWEKAVDTCHAALGPVGVLVNNAGISPKTDGRKIAGRSIPLAEWRRVVDVNLTGAFLGVQAVAPDMVDRQWGRIVNMSSQAGRTGTVVAGVHYGATKTALIGLTRAFAGELAGDGITVNAVAPGKIETPMMRGAVAESNEDFLRGIPVGHFGSPGDIAALVSFLAGDESRFITGATVDANGGSFMG
ncbi:SDR family oxidoreductase [Aeromicrobium chenweiae]|nr:SDR family NAD(P)-dependent oxidoreductase [Aeromicrobium chenweiae]